MGPAVSSGTHSPMVSAERQLRQERYSAERQLGLLLLRSAPKGSWRYSAERQLHGASSSSSSRSPGQRRPASPGQKGYWPSVRVMASFGTEACSCPAYQEVVCALHAESCNSCSSATCMV